MTHGDTREGKWRGNWRMQWVASTLHTTSKHGVSSITTADVHNSAASSWLKRRPLADLNGLVRFAERRNLVSARVSSHFKCDVMPPNNVDNHLHPSSDRSVKVSSEILVPVYQTTQGHITQDQMEENRCCGNSVHPSCSSFTLYFKISLKFAISLETFQCTKF